MNVHEDDKQAGRQVEGNFCLIRIYVDMRIKKPREASLAAAVIGNQPTSTLSL